MHTWYEQAVFYHIYPLGLLGAEKTKEDIPKGKIFDCVKALKTVEVAAPVHIGDVILKDVAGTGVDVVATKNVE